MEVKMAVRIDPFEVYRKSDEAIMAASGILPMWIATGLLECDGNIDKFWEGVMACYPYPVDPRKADIEPNMNYRSPGDPDLRPLLTISFDGLTAAVYPYSFVGVTDGVDASVCRLD